MNEALAGYPSPTARAEEFKHLCLRVGAEVVAYGQSVEGRTLQGAFIKGRSHEGRSVCVCANIHGIEWISNRLAHAFTASLKDGPGAALLDKADVWVFPCLNPDGYEKTFKFNGKGRVRDMRKNARQVDLNRNFPLPFGKEPSWIPTAGSDKEDDATYRGSSPLSEPETKSLVGVLDDIKPWASANLHSFMGTLIPPKTPCGADRQNYRELHARFAQAQSKSRYRILQSAWLDVFTGEQEDYQHHVHQTWACCIETFPIAASFAQHVRAPSAFWRFNPRDLHVWLDNDLPAVVSFLAQALTLDRPRSDPKTATPRTTWRQGAE